MNHSSRPLRKPLMMGAVILAAITLSGCGVVNAITGGAHHTEIYQDAAAAQGKLGDLPATEWITEDATQIRIKYAETGAIMMYTSPTKPDTTECTESAAPTEFPTVDSWWPSTLPEKVHSCGDWDLFSTNSHVYAITMAPAES